MTVINKTARLICLNTIEGRVDLLPSVITEDKRLDKLKGNDKVFDHYLDNEDLKEIGKKKEPTERERLISEAVQLGVDGAGDLSVKKLKIAIHEAKTNS